jgi:hypothetical protein
MTTETEIKFEDGDTDCGFPPRFYLVCPKCGEEIEGDKLEEALELLRTTGNDIKVNGDVFQCQCGAEYVGCSRLPVFVLLEYNKETEEDEL